MAEGDKGTRLQDWLGQQDNPAAPAGAQQTARLNANEQPAQGSRLSEWLAGSGSAGGDDPYTSQAQSWLTGRNAEGTNNGWDTQFVSDFQTGWDAALEAGAARSYFDSDNATGVVTWDHQSKDGEARQFGDIYEKGEKKGNVYDLYDRDDANLMMSQWVLDDDTMAQTFSASDRMERLEREVTATRADRSANFEDQLKALEFEGDVTKREEAFAEGFVDEALVAGSATATGVLTAGLAAGGTAAAAGSWSGPGALIAGAAGFVAGGLGAYWNRDTLTEQAARAYEITSLSYTDNGLPAAVGTGLHQYSGVGMKMISPLSNLTQGGYDVAVGRGGDGESEMYRTNEEGERTAPKLVRALDVGATVGDSFLQFASPVGMAAYTAAMSGTVAGQIGELTFSGGETFDYRRAGFDNIFTDDDGNFDASSAAAGIGVVAIDAVQLGMVRGLAGRADASLRATGQQPFYGKMLGGISSKMPTRLGGSRGLAANEERVRAAGFSFTRDKTTGAIVEGSQRKTLGLLAPSEQIAAIETRYLAKRMAARNGGAYSADDFYRAAQAIAAGEQRLTSTIVNAMGEGYEEVMQAVLEPYSHGDSATAEEIIEAGVYGTAAGFGMSASTMWRGASAQDRMFAMASASMEMQTGQPLDRAEFNAMPEIQRRQLAAMSDVERMVAQAAHRKITQDQAIEATAGVAGTAKLLDAVKSQLDTAAAKATDRTDGAFVITQLEEMPRLDAQGNLLPGAMASHAVGSSAHQLAVNLTQHMRGIAIQHEKLIADAREIAETFEPGPELDARVEAITEQIATAELTLQWGARIDQAVDTAMERIDNSATAEEVAAEIAELNELLGRAFDMSIDDLGGEVLTPADKRALARAVSPVFVRDPQDADQSYQVLLPQASVALTLEGTDNLLQVSHAILAPIGGDFDGDKIRQQAQLVLDDNAFDAMRTGVNYIGAGGGVNIATPKYEEYNVQAMSDSLAGDNVVLASLASESLIGIGRAIRNRYESAIDSRALDAALDAFNNAVRAGDTKARAALLDTLATHGGGQLTEFARTNLTNEFLWIDQLIVSTIQRFQESYAEARPQLGVPLKNAARPTVTEREVRERHANHWATLGQTLGALAPGDSMFRKFQKLHYTVLNAPVDSANAADTTALSELVQLYREISQSVTRRELDRVRGKDDITSRVYAQLDQLAADAMRLDDRLSKHEALVTVANLEVSELKISEEGEFTPTGKTVTLAQMLLRQSVVKDQREKFRVLEASPELQAKHAKLMAMTRPSRDGQGAERTFVEVVGAQQMFTLLGNAAMPFGPHLSVEQWLRYYGSLSETERRDETRRLRSAPEYVGPKAHKSLPYTIEDISEGKVTPYRTMVDALVAVGNNRLAISADGKLSGEIADRSDRVSENFAEAWRQVNIALREFAGLQAGKDGELTTDQVRRMFESAPDFARQVMDLIPNASANAVFEVRDGEVFVANWVYGIFTAKNAAAAEMHYWRNLLLAEWTALGAPTIRDEAEAGENGRTYARLPRRMHRILYDLAAHAQTDGGLLYQQFIQQMEQAESVESFLKWLNTSSGIRGAQAPITAWIDDVAEFDMDKAAGGWTTALQGAELREAITMLRSRSENLVRELREERAAMKKDLRLIGQLEEVARFDAGLSATKPSEEMRNLWLRYTRSLELAAEAREAMGPQAMIYQTIGATRGFYGQAHNKGTNPDNVRPAGEAEARRDAFGYVTNYGRLMGSLTSTSLDAVSTNMAQVAKDGGRTMDDYGRTVEWDRPDPTEMLELLKNPETRPFARSVLFPQAVERGPDGVLRPQFLIGKSLTDLLNGVSHDQLFPRNGVLSADAASRYNTMVEGVARKHGGHLALQRAVNDLVIARTSYADHELSAYEIEAMTSKAYYEMAQVLQAVGSIAARETTPGTDALAEILDTVRSTQRRLRVANSLGLSYKEADEVTDFALDAFIEERQTQSRETIVEIGNKIEADPDNVASYEAELAAEEAALERFLKRVELLRSDDTVGQVVDMFTIAGDATEQASKKQAIVDYVRSHLNMIEEASDSKLLINKLTQQMLDPAYAGQPVLTDKEWNKLSAAVVGVYLDDALSSRAAGISVSPWPDADHADQHRYFDTSFAFLVEPMLKSDSPLVKAAREVHLVANRHGQERMSTERFVDLLGRTVLDHKRLGPWTSDLPRAMVTANERLDSASAGPAIAMAGDSPKNQIAAIAATERTFKVPGAALLSRTQLSWIDLQRDLTDEVEVELPTGAGRRPLAQLNNRFAASVKMAMVDGQGQMQTYDLLAESPQLGRRWHGNAGVRDSGYVEIHIERLQRAVEQVAIANGGNPARARVEVEFFHPDSQPAEPGWYHNIFFEGTSFNLDADTQKSLLATLWFKNGAISPAAQAAALDASKLGKAALQVIEVPTASERKALEAEWATDLAAVIRAKTTQVMKTDLGFGALEAEYFNAVYKDMKLHHWVRGLDENGEPVLWDAERVIAAQAAGTPLPEQAELWVPTDEVLRSMMGEQGTKGVSRFLGEQLELDPSRIRQYQGDTTEIASRFDVGVAGETVRLHETRIGQRARQSQMQVRTKMDPATRSAFDAQMRHFSELEATIHADRTAAEVSDSTFDVKKNLGRAVEAGESILQAENLTMYWAMLGVPFGPRSSTNNAASKMLLKDIAALTEADQFRTGWVYREGAKSQPQVGLLSEVSLGSPSRDAFRVAPGDLVVLELDSFNGDTELAKRRIDHLAGQGATILLGATDGQSDVRAEMSEYLMGERQYEPVIGSQHAFRPMQYGSRFQNNRARLSTLTEVSSYSAKNRIAVLYNLDGKAVEENAAWINSGNPRLRSVGVSGNLVPTAAMAGFNVPVGNQVDRVRAKVRSMLENADARALLHQQANGHLDGDERTEADRDLDEHLNKLLLRFDDNQGAVLPVAGEEFGKGSIIPLVDHTGRVLLYRHGFQALRRDQIDEYASLALPSTMDAAGMAIFPTKPEPAATIHTGRVVEISERAGFGLMAELDIPLSDFGNKFQLESNGMKFVFTPRPDSVALPDHGFFPGWGPDVVASAFDMASKESYADLVDNHRSAFAFFGMDFTEDATEFFFPGKGQDADSQQLTLEVLNHIATRAPRIPVEMADELIALESMGQSFADLIPEAVANGVPGVNGSWVTEMTGASTPQARIASAMVVYLMTPGARVEDVLRTGGFNDPNPELGGRTRGMPRLFTQIFDRAPIGSALRTEINQRLNRAIENPVDGKGYVLHQDFTFETFPEPGSTKGSMRSLLAFPEAHSSGDNPVKNGMSFDTAEKGSVSQHSAAIAYAATGAKTAFAHDIAKARAFAEGKGMRRLERDVVDGGTWRMLTDIPKDDKTFRPHRRDTPAMQARRRLAREAVTEFRQPLEMSERYGWTQPQINEYLEARLKIIHELKMEDAQADVVDFWVRQMLGAPLSLDADGEGWVSGKAAIQEAEEILWNVRNRYLPTAGATVALMHLHDLQALYRANKDRADGWKPRESMDPDSATLVAWDSWVETALGVVNADGASFDPLYLLATDGLMHTYQNATRALMDLPISMDTLKSAELLDERTNAMLVSISNPASLIASEPVLLDAMKVELSEVLSGKRIGGSFAGKAAPASEIARKRAARIAWRKENGIPVPVDVTAKNFRKQGAQFINESTNTNALVRVVTNLRVGQALLNPALYVSMGPEQWIRGMLDRVANTLTGQATVGMTAMAQSRATQAMEGTKLGAVADAIGIGQRYTPAQLTALKQLYQTMGKRHDFTGEIYRDLNFRRHVHEGRSWIERGSEKFARAGAAMQDPTYGTRSNTMARRYLEAALQHIQATPTINVISTDVLIAELMTDPLYLKKRHPEVHQFATNAVAQIRSLKSTLLSETLQGIYEPLTENSNAFVSTFANLLLKVPMIFSTYAGNVATTITGMQGVNDMAAMFLDGRAKGPNSFFGRIQAAMRGEEFNPQTDAEFDMSSVIEGIDLSRSFIRGGLTHTGLFLTGMMAGSLGLSGEDEEARRRRLLAEAQGVGTLYDPRRIENDFRNADAIYLDALPFGIGGLFTPDEGSGRAVAQPHWIVKQFLSPVMGMEKFFQTGDFRQVTWGFEDAMGAFPLINKQTWDDVVRTGQMLLGDAEPEVDDNGAVVEQMGLLTSVVGTYERMLLENSFVNQLYVGFDDWDRDPYVLPLTDSEGTIQRDIEGNARPNDQALSSFINDAGEVQQGYLGRSDRSAALHVLTENRGTLAAISALFTGGFDSDYLRRNMPIKTREIEKREVSLDEAKSIVLAASGYEQRKQPNVTFDEALPVVRQALFDMAEATGQFFDNDQIASATENFVASQGLLRTEMEGNLLEEAQSFVRKNGTEKLSFTDEKGNEQLTDAGAAAVLRGLWKGSVQLGDESLRDIHITGEQREKIQADWTKELVQEGIEIGLDKVKAISRMKRIMYGPMDDPSVNGLADILWSSDDKISYSPKEVYGQLNTTYVMGPDGRPWATGFKRASLLEAMGLPPYSRQHSAAQGTGQDSRGNTTNLIAGSNTGLRALVPMNDTRYIPTDQEIGEKIEKAIEEAAKAEYTPYEPFEKKDGSSGYSGYGNGWKNYGSGWKNYGSGGGGGGGAYFTKMYNLPRNVAPYGNSASFINTSNPIIRRTNVRRERVWSERGRLKQWQ